MTAAVGAPTGPLVAFLGPSLPREEAAAAAPQVRFRPPIRQGDLTSVLEFDRPAGVLIVDGEFGQSLSVWHKEILLAISRGVRVLGASSMGALRAAELDRYGMEGIGEVYAYYRDHFLAADEDVALIHTDAETGWRPMTWPMVNLRATVAALHERGEIDGDEAAALLAAAQSLHFSERVRAALAARLTAAGIARGPELAALVAAHYVDQKRADALAGLDRLCRLDTVPAPSHEHAKLIPSRYFGLEFSDVTVPRPSGSLYRYQLVNDAALHEPDFVALADRAADRAIAQEVAREFQLDVDDEDLAVERREWLLARELTEATLAGWLAAADLDEGRLAELIRQLAIQRKVRRSIRDLRFFERNRRLVIEQLQLEGRYAAVADAAARRVTLARQGGAVPYPTTGEAVGDLLGRHSAATGWRPNLDVVTYADDQGFEGPAGLLVALTDAVGAFAESQRRRERVAAALGLPRTGGPGGPATGSVGQTAPPPGGALAAAGAAGGLEAVAAARLHALLETHQVTQVLLAAVDLGLAAALADGPRTVAEVAAATGAQPDRLGRLLAVLRLMGVVAERDRTEHDSTGNDSAGNDSTTNDGTGDRTVWELTAVGRWLDPDRAHSLEPYARDLRDGSMPAWAGLADAVRGASPPPYPTGIVPELAVDAAGHVLDLPGAVAHLLDLPAGGHLVDIGGGLGAIAEAVATARPDLRVTLVEVPETAERAADRLRHGPAGDRITVESSPIPAGRSHPDEADREADHGADHESLAVGDADCCLFVRVLLNVEDGPAAALLGEARRRLRPGGRIEIVDIHADGSPVAVLNDLFNLARSGGKVRDAVAWQHLAESAGLRLERVEPLRTPLVRVTLTPAAPTPTPAPTLIPTLADTTPALEGAHP